MEVASKYITQDWREECECINCKTTYSFGQSSVFVFTDIRSGSKLEYVGTYCPRCACPSIHTLPKIVHKLASNNGSRLSGIEITEKHDENNYVERDCECCGVTTKFYVCDWYKDVTCHICLKKLDTIVCDKYLNISCDRFKEFVDWQKTNYIAQTDSSNVDFERQCTCKYCESSFTANLSNTIFGETKQDRFFKSNQNLCFTKHMAKIVLEDLNNEELEVTMNFCAAGDSNSYVHYVKKYVKAQCSFCKEWVNIYCYCLNGKEGYTRTNPENYNEDFSLILYHTLLNRKDTTTDTNTRDGLIDIPLEQTPRNKNKCFIL